jgi:multiple sugar transport system substrate-binding protein
MKKMTSLRLVILLVLVLIPVLSLSAQDEEEITLDVIGLTVTPEEVGSPLDEARTGVAERFMEANPSITINRVEAPPDFDTQLLLDLTAGTAVDVWYQDASTLARLVDTGNVLDMNICLELVPDFTLDRFNNFLSIHQREDGLWGVPDGGTPMVMYINPESFERAGIELPSSDWTWDEFLETTQMLTLDAEGRNRLDPDFDEDNVVQWGFRVRQYLFEWIYWVWQNGGDVISPDGTTVDGYLNSPESIEAIQFLADMVLVHGVAPEPNALDQLSQQFGFLTSFLLGDVAMFPRGHWEMVGLQLNEEYTPDRVMVVGNPVREADATVLYESGWVINGALQDEPARLEAACRFVEALTNTEFQSSKVVTGLEISANAAAADMAPEESTYPAITEVFVQEVADGRLPYGALYANWPLIEEAINLMMENILAGGDVEEEIEIAVEEIERELERANRG